MGLSTVTPNQLSRIQPHTYAPFLTQLKTLFASMDRKYNEAAHYYGFNCSGCRDNCCRTRFYHHTLLEYFYLHEGFKSLAPKQQNSIKLKAAEVCRRTELADEKGLPVRLMCPLNSDGLCRLYAHRPMICRMFGIPHELQPPGAPAEYRPGCGTFSELTCDKKYFKFNRTPFFTEMAQMELKLKQTAGLMQKIKLTVAEMVVSF